MVASSGTGGMASAVAGAVGVSAGRAGATEPAAVGGAGSPAAAGAPASGPLEKFSFFVTSLEGMQKLSGNPQGFGGDLRHGEATGLAGADKICTELAESSMPGAGAKGWRAFLSAAKAGPGGQPVHAKDRIGKGPWYDRLGRVVAMDLTSLLSERPTGADAVIGNDLPNEQGIPNGKATTGNMTDNHDVVTGTNQQGMWDGTMTCEDWTSTQTPMAMPAAGSGAAGRSGFGGFAMSGPRLGHSWPSAQSGRSWMTVHMAPGCSPSVALVQMGGGQGTGIGNAGGYGGIYCFALMP